MSGSNAPSRIDDEPREGLSPSEVTFMKYVPISLNILELF